MEFFDIVNDKDKIIGKASRKECHKNHRLIHRGIYVIVTNEREEILISKRSMKKDVSPGKWEVLGEHNQVGESYKNAAKRGLKEELGLSAPLKNLFRFKLKTKLETEFDDVFLCKIKNNTKINFDKNEITEVSWVSFNTLRKLIKQKNFFTDWSAFVLKEYLKNIHK